MMMMMMMMMSFGAEMFKESKEKEQRPLGQIQL